MKFSREPSLQDRSSPTPWKLAKKWPFNARCGQSTTKQLVNFSLLQCLSSLFPSSRPIIKHANSVTVLWINPNTRGAYWIWQQLAHNPPIITDTWEFFKKAFNTIDVSFSCVCLDREFCHKIIIVDPETTLTMLSRNSLSMTDTWKTDIKLSSLLMITNDKTVRSRSFPKV